MIGLGSAYGILLVVFTFVHSGSLHAQIVPTLFVFYHHASPHRFCFAIIDGGKLTPFYQATFAFLVVHCCFPRAHHHDNWLFPFTKKRNRSLALLHVCYIAF